MNLNIQLLFPISVSLLIIAVIILLVRLKKNTHHRFILQKVIKDLEKEVNDLKNYQNKLKHQGNQLQDENQKLLNEKNKLSKKYLKMWKTSEKIYKLQKDISIKNDKLEQLTQELEEERMKIKKKNQKLWNQGIAIHKEKEKVEEIKRLIEIKHKEVVESIDYAKRIQSSILPDIQELSTIFPNSFVFFKPVKTVSGDFYWWKKTNSHFIITAADCTGHGVPGAFMSMLGSAYLNDIVLNEKIFNPNEILEILRSRVIESLKQTSDKNEQMDGMDMALCSIDMENKKLQFAGANNPLYIIRKKTNMNDFDTKFISLENKSHCLLELKPDKMPVGIHWKMDRFKALEIKLFPQDRIFMFSDGYADQFGGKKGKKFKYKPFKKLLLDITDQDMHSQKDTLNNTMTEWVSYTDPYTNKPFEQIDDIIIVGLEI